MKRDGESSTAQLAAAVTESTTELATAFAEGTAEVKSTSPHTKRFLKTRSKSKLAQKSARRLEQPSGPLVHEQPSDEPRVQPTITDEEIENFEEEHLTTTNPDEPHWPDIPDAIAKESFVRQITSAGSGQGSAQWVRMDGSAGMDRPFTGTTRPLRDRKTAGDSGVKIGAKTSRHQKAWAAIEAHSNLIGALQRMGISRRHDSSMSPAEQADISHQVLIRVYEIEANRQGKLSALLERGAQQAVKLVRLNTNDKGVKFEVTWQLVTPEPFCLAICAPIRVQIVSRWPAWKLSLLECDMFDGHFVVHQSKSLGWTSLHVALKGLLYDADARYQQLAMQQRLHVIGGAPIEVAQNHKHQVYHAEALTTWITNGSADHQSVMDHLAALNNLQMDYYLLTETNAQEKVSQLLVSSYGADNVIRSTALALLQKWQQHLPPAQRVNYTEEVSDSHASLQRMLKEKTSSRLNRPSRSRRPPGSLLKP